MLSLLRISPLACVLLLLMPLRAGAQEGGISYTNEEIKNLTSQFKSLAKDRKQPEDDAITSLGELVQAYEFLGKKGDQATKDEQKVQKSIIDAMAWGLKRRKRPQVNLECAKALGRLGDKGGTKALVKWMDGTVLDSKTPNPEWVEYGFMALANIGDEGAALDLIYDYGPKARHIDYSVADKALGAVPYWKKLSAKNRKELYNKILMQIQSLDSGRRQGGNKQRIMQERFDRVKINGFKALQELAGESKPFANVTKATDWWKTNKGGKWQDFIGLNHRKKVTPKPKDKPKDEPKDKPKDKKES
jgi:hypothetical protein